MFTACLKSSRTHNSKQSFDIIKYIVPISVAFGISLLNRRYLLYDLFKDVQ